MDQIKLSAYKQNLERERLLLIAEVKSHEKPVDYGTDTEDREEEVDKEVAFSNELAIAQDLKNRLEEIDVALGKIYSGKYGLCEKCGGAIEDGVLVNDPASRLCKHCGTAA